MLVFSGAESESSGTFTTVGRMFTVRLSSAVQNDSFKSFWVCFTGLFYGLHKEKACTVFFLMFRMQSGDGGAVTFDLVAFKASCEVLRPPTPSVRCRWSDQVLSKGWRWGHSCSFFDSCVEQGIRACAASLSPTDLGHCCFKLRIEALTAIALRPPQMLIIPVPHNHHHHLLAFQHPSICWFHFSLSWSNKEVDQ